MRKIILALLVLAATQLQASHILSGHFTYEYVSTSGNQKTYEVNLYLFRDITGINLPGTTTVYYKKSNQTGSGTMLTLTQQGNSTTGTNMCGSTLNYAMHHYQATVTLDAGSAYDFAYSTCCRPAIIDNLSNASSQTIYLTTKIVTSRADVRSFNNSVDFDNVIFSAPAGKDIPLKLCNADPDGDSLSFQVTSVRGGTANTLTPTSLSYAMGYGNSAPFGTNGSFSIDTANRVMIARSAIQQNATVNIRVIEWAKDTTNTYKIMGVTEKEFLFNFTNNSPTGTISATAASGNFGSDTVYVSTSEDVFPYYANFDSTQIVLTDPNGDTTDYVLDASPFTSFQDLYLQTTAFLTPGSWTVYFGVNQDSTSVVGACGKPLIDSISFFVVPPIIQIAGPTDSVYGSDPVTYTLQNTTYVDSVTWSTANGTIQAAYSKDSVTVQWGTTGNGPASLTAIGWTYGFPDTVSISVSVHGIGIQERSLLSGAYPNPVTDYFYLNSAESLEVKLFDYLGRTYLSTQATQRVDLSQIPNGKYILTVSSSTQTDRIPLVISH